MQFHTAPTSQSSRHTSIFGLMYANQYAPAPDAKPAVTSPQESLQHSDIANHIEDLCDCV